MKKLYSTFWGRTTCKSSSFILFLLLIPGIYSFAQTTVVTVGGGATVICPATPTATWTTPPTGISFSNWSRGSGVTCATATTALSGSGFNTADATTSFSGSKYFSVTISANTTTSFTLDAVLWNTAVSSGTANFTVKYSNNGGPVTDFGTVAQTSTSSNTFTGSVTVSPSTSIILYLIPAATGAAGTTVRWVNGSTITVTASSCASPTINTASVSNVTTVSADLSASIASSGGGLNITERGVQYSTNSSLSSPTSNPETGASLATGGFTRSITGLQPNTLYYYRGYAKNDCAIPQTGYTHTSGFPTFTTLPDPPVANAASAISSTGFTANWQAPASAGNAAYTYTLELSTDVGFGFPSIYSSIASGTLSQALSSLSPSTQYWYRVKSVNSSGVSVYSNIIGPVMTLSPSPIISVTSYINNSTFNFNSVVIGATPSQVFTINNTGNATLNISSITITGTGYSLQGTIPTTIPAGGTATVTVQFAPTNPISYTGVLTINSNASNTSTYIINLSGTGQANSLSDITYNSVSSASQNSNIAYNLYQSAIITNTSSGNGGSIGVMGFTIRDGGGSADADNLPTILTGISFTVANPANIRSAALFNGNALIQSVAVGGSSITFSGLSGTDVTCPDNGTLSLNLRVTFNASVTDNQKLTFTVASTTVATGGTSSSFAASNAGGALSDNTSSDINRIEVTADRIAFTSTITDQAINTNLATFTIAVKDALSNIDLDGTQSVTLTTSGTGMTSASPYTLSNGTISILDVQFSTLQSGITLTAGTSGLAFSNSAISNSFNIINATVGSYRTAGNGTWSTASWERFISGSGWTTNSAPPTSSTDSIYIRHLITIANLGNPKIVIQNGGTLTISSPSTLQSLRIEAGGLFQMNAALTILGSLEVEDFGSFNMNYAGTTSTFASTLWNGTENFHPNSNLVIQGWADAANQLIPSGTVITSNTYNGFNAWFGNIIFDGTGNGTNKFELCANTGITGNLTHNNLILRNGNSQTFKFCNGNGNLSLTLGGDLILESTFNMITSLTTSNSAVITLTVKKNFTQSAPVEFRMMSSTGSTITTINIGGNLQINNGSLIFNRTSSSTVTGVATVNLDGNLNISGGYLDNTNNFKQGIFNFSGIGDGTTPLTTQTINVSPVTGRNQYIDYFIKPTAYVQLSNQDFSLGTSSMLTVSGNVSYGGTLDFNFNGTTALNINSILGASSTKFKTEQGSTLKISSPSGIVATSGTVGNVQVTIAPSYDQVATFWYVGKVNQVMGSGINATSTGRQVIIELMNNLLTISPSTQFAVTNNTAISTTGGKVVIRSGKLIETTTNYITGSTGTLYMSGGTLYQIAKGNTTLAASNSDQIPRMSGGTYPYVLTGGTIELTGNGASDAFQTLRTVANANPYKYVKFSGANTYLTDWKNLNSSTAIDSALIITGNTVVDCSDASGAAASFTGNGGITMDGGRLRLLQRSNPQPQLDGINLPYSLTGGIIEFYNSGGASRQTIRGTYNSTPIVYKNIEVTGSFVGNSSSNITLGVGGTFKVKAGGNFEINDNSIKGSGDLSQSVTVENGGTFRTGNDQGFHGFTATFTSSSSIHSNITNINLATGSTVEYIRSGTQTITNSGNLIYQNLSLMGSGNKTAPATDLQVQGNLTGGGTASFVHNNSSVTLNGSAIQNYTNTSSPFIFYTLNDNNSIGININSDCAVEKELLFNGTAKLILNVGSITMKSGPSLTSRIGVVPNGAISYNGQGRFIIERYITNLRRWHFLSIPTITTQTFKDAWQEGAASASQNPVPGYGMQITDEQADWFARNFDSRSVSGPSIKTYSSVTDSYTGINNTNNNIQTTAGYMTFVRGDRLSMPGATTLPSYNTILRTKGQIYQGDQSRIFSGNDQFFPVGNPYASQIDLRYINFNGLKSSVYVWDPYMPGGYGLGKYVFLLNMGSYFDPIPTGVTYTSPHNTIESGQAFFVQSTPVTETHELKLFETSKSNGSSPIYTRNGITNLSPELLKSTIYSITSTGLDVMDGNVTVFGNRYHQSLDNYDVTKIRDNGFTFGISNSGKVLVADMRPYPILNDTLQYFMGNVRLGRYQWKVETRNYNQRSQHAWMVDRYTNTKVEIDLTGSTTFDFEIINNPGSYAQNRFYIIFNKNVIIPIRSAESLKPGKFELIQNPVTSAGIQLKSINVPAGKYTYIVKDRMLTVVSKGNFNANGTIPALRLPFLINAQYFIEIFNEKGVSVQEMPFTILQ